MTSITLDVSSDLILKLLNENGPDAKIQVQDDVIERVAQLMLSEYKRDTEDRILRDEVLDEFCEPAKDYWTRNNVTLKDNFRDAIKRQVKLGVDQLISNSFNEKMKEIDKMVSDYAEGLKAIADQSIQKYIDTATEAYIQERVNERLRQVASQIG